MKEFSDSLAQSDGFDCIFHQYSNFHQAFFPAVEVRMGYRGPISDLKGIGRISIFGKIDLFHLI